MFARWALLVSLFLTFVSDLGAPYADWFSPFNWAHWFIEAMPWKVRPIDHVFVLCLLLAPRGRERQEPAVRPMRRVLYLCAATTVVWFLYGSLRGGDSWAASWQIYLLLSGVLCAFAVAALFRTPEHYALLAKMLLLAAGYRAVMCCAYYFMYINPGLVYPVPEYLTSHDDTVLWVGCILLLLLAMVDPIGRPRRVKQGALLLFLVAAVFFNQRPIAWVSLATGAMLLLFLLPAGKPKRRAVRTLVALAPVMAIYVAVGWGRTEKIFKPLQSFSTVSTAEDTSTKARNVENLGLIATSNANNALLGTGWGHPYIEVSNKYSIAKYFPLWQYIPHNSILGLLAYTGILGLGTYYVKGVYMLSLSYAIALRLPIVAGVWPAPRGSLSGAPQPAPGGAAMPAGYRQEA